MVKKRLMAGKSAKRAKTPVLLQMEATECGAAALGSVLGYYGLYLPLERLRIECGVSRDGSRASNMVRAARRLGMQAGGFRYSPEQVREREMPMIIHWKFNHFVVLEGFDGEQVCLNDPGCGHRKVAWREFEESFTGIALAVTPGADFKGGGKPVGSIAMIAGRLREHKKTLGFLLAAGLGLVAPGLAFPAMQQIFMDDILTRRHEDWMLSMLIAMGATALLQGTLAYLRGWCLTRWQGNLTIGGSSRFFWHVLHLPMEFFQQRYSGEVASRAQFNAAASEALAGQAAIAALDCLPALFYLLLLFQYNVALTLIGCVFSGINAMALLWMFRWMKERQMRVMQDAGKAYGVSVAGIQNIETLKANGNEGDFFVKWAGYHSRMLEVSQETEGTQLFFMLTPVLLSGLNTAVIMAVGGFEIMDGVMTVGIFVAFQTLMGNFQEPIHKLLNSTQSVQLLETQIRRMDDVLRYPRDESLKFLSDASGVELGKLNGQLELHDVTFGYNRLEPPLLEHFNLVLEPGRRVALVGGSGSGKSTVAKLIMGLYQPWSGEILFDGAPRPLIAREVLTHSVAGVDQDVFLFSGSVADNIALFDSTVQRVDVVRAAKDAEIHEDVAALPGGYEADVEEGGRNFSGGQRQRLEIARALAGNPAILVLDEATSSLDPLTERRVTDNISRRGCACLVIAHRLSTIRDCDEIIVLDKGKVVQRGVHEALMATAGPYRQLMETDFGRDAFGREGAEK